MKGLVWLIGTIFSWLELLFLFLVIHLLFMYFWLCLKYLESNKHALETFLWQNWMHQLCFWDLIKDPGTSFNLVKKLVRMRKYFQKWSYNFKMWCSRIVVMWCSRIKHVGMFLCLVPTLEENSQNIFFNSGAIDKRTVDCHILKFSTLSIARVT